MDFLKEALMAFLATTKGYTIQIHVEGASYEGTLAGIGSDWLELHDIPREQRVLVRIDRVIAVTSLQPYQKG